jgi:hypothetical protein
MLASTMQFSKNNPTPPPPTKDAGNDREDQPHTPNPHNKGGQGCVQPQNPIACLHLKPTNHTTLSIPRREYSDSTRPASEAPIR